MDTEGTHPGIGSQMNGHLPPWTHTIVVHGPQWTAQWSRPWGLGSGLQRPALARVEKTATRPSAITPAITKLNTLRAMVFPSGNGNFNIRRPTLTLARVGGKFPRPFAHCS